MHELFLFCLVIYIALALYIALVLCPVYGRAV